MIEIQADLGLHERHHHSFYQKREGEKERIDTIPQCWDHLSLIPLSYLKHSEAPRSQGCHMIQSSLSVILASVFSTVKNVFQSESEKSNMAFPESPGRQSDSLNFIPKCIIFFIASLNEKITRMPKMYLKCFKGHQKCIDFTQVLNKLCHDIFMYQPEKLTH